MNAERKAAEEEFNRMFLETAKSAKNLTKPGEKPDLMSLMDAIQPKPPPAAPKAPAKGQPPLNPMQARPPVAAPKAQQAKGQTPFRSHFEGAEPPLVAPKAQQAKAQIPFRSHFEEGLADTKKPQTPSRSRFDQPAPPPQVSKAKPQTPLRSHFEEEAELPSVPSAKAAKAKAQGPARASRFDEDPGPRPRKVPPPPPPPPPPQAPSRPAPSLEQLETTAQRRRSTTSPPKSPASQVTSSRPTTDPFARLRKAAEAKAAKGQPLPKPSSKASEDTEPEHLTPEGLAKSYGLDEESLGQLFDERTKPQRKSQAKAASRDLDDDEDLPPRQQKARPEPRVTTQKSSEKPSKRKLSPEEEVDASIKELQGEAGKYNPNDATNIYRGLGRIDSLLETRDKARTSRKKLGAKVGASKDLMPGEEFDPYVKKGERGPDPTPERVEVDQNPANFYDSIDQDFLAQDSNLRYERQEKKKKKNPGGQGKDEDAPTAKRLEEWKADNAPDPLVRETEDSTYLSKSKLADNMEHYARDPYGWKTSRDTRLNKKEAAVISRMERAKIRAMYRSPPELLRELKDDQDGVPEGREDGKSLRQTRIESELMSLMQDELNKPSVLEARSCPPDWEVEVVHCSITRDLRRATFYIDMQRSVAVDAQEHLLANAKYYRYAITEKMQLKWSPQIIFEFNPNKLLDVNEVLDDYELHNEIRKKDEALIELIKRAELYD